MKCPFDISFHALIAWFEDEQTVAYNWCERQILKQLKKDHGFSPEDYPSQKPTYDTVTALEKIHIKMFHNNLIVIATASCTIHSKNEAFLFIDCIGHAKMGRVHPLEIQDSVNEYLGYD